MGITDFNYDYLNAKLGIKDKNDLKNKILESITDLDMSVMVRDVLPFLIKSDDKDRILNFREYIGQRLK